jgi:hypothetical protein
MTRTLPKSTTRRTLHAMVWFAIAAVLASIAVTRKDFVMAGTAGAAMFLPLCAGIGVLFDRGARGFLIGELMELFGWAVIASVALFAT